MLQLIVDPIRRWWWVLALVFLLTVGSTANGSPFLLAPVGVVLLFLDAQDGLIRTTATLPVSLATHARARWIFAVPFVVVTCGIGMLIGTVLLVLVSPHRWVSWPSRSLEWWGLWPWVLQTWVALGHAGLTFIGLSFATNRPPETFREHLTQIFVGLCWGLSIVGLIWLTPNLPWYTLTFDKWHWILMIAVPLLIGWSYFASERFIRQQALPRSQKTSKPPQSQKSEMKGMVGIPLYLLAIPARVVVFTLVMTSVQWFTIRVISDQWTSYINMGVFQFAIFGIFISTFVTEQVSLRTLRALPLSALKLTLLLLSGPSISATGIVFLWVPEALQHGLSWASVWKMAEMVLLLAGSGALCLALVLRFVRIGRLGMIFAVAVLAPFAILFLPEIPGAAAAFGAATGIAGYLLLSYSIRRSSTAYQPRKIFGMALAQSQ